MTIAIQRVLLFLFLHIHVHFLNIVSASQLPDLRYSSCGTNGNYTENSACQNNLNTLLSSLSSKIDNNGFSYASDGQSADKVSGIVLCRGDVELEQCRICVNNIAQKLLQLCPTQKRAIGGYDNCSLQYSNDSSILETTSFSLQYYFSNPANATKPEEFNQERSKLLENLRDRAVDDGSSLKYATGNATGPDFQSIYALVQCTPDLSPQNCLKCLTVAYENMPNCPCNGKRGGRIIVSRCNLRYESSKFFYVALGSPPPAGNDDKTAPMGNDDEKAPTGNDNTAPIVQDDKKARLVIIIIVSNVIVVILTVCISVILMKKRKRKLVDKIQGTLGDDISDVETLQYDFSTIRAATDNFSNANKLGQGGFGPVYKVIRPA